jgi:hypothetical protein
MRVGVRVGPVYLSTSTRRRRPKARTWHGTGRTTTPDGREVDFRCHHGHRTRSAALECSANIRKQIGRGQSLHLITRVRSTPASREAARQRALQKEARRRAKADKRAAAAEQRAQQRETLARRAQRQVLERQQQVLERQTRQTAAAQPYVGQPVWGPRPGSLNTRQSPQRQSHSWSTIGLLIAGAVMLVGFVLAGMDNKNPHSPQAASGAALITLAFLAALICAIAATWRRLHRRARDERSASVAYSAGDGPGHYPQHSYTAASGLGYAGNPYSAPAHPSANGQWPHGQA